MKKNKIKEKYEWVLDYYKNDNPNGINCYVCDKCGHITKTIDTAPGVTPFLHDCEVCGEFARSTFYKDIIPDQEPTQEWFRPTLEECYEMECEACLEHILNGGLDVRTIEKSN